MTSHTDKSIHTGCSFTACRRSTERRGGGGDLNPLPSGSHFECLKYVSPRLYLRFAVSLSLRGPFMMLHGVPCLCSRASHFTVPLNWIKIQEASHLMPISIVRMKIPGHPKPHFDVVDVYRAKPKPVGYCGHFARPSGPTEHGERIPCDL